MKDLLLHSLHVLGVPSLLRTRKRHKLTVLSLHRVSEERNTFWNPVRPKTFDLLLSHVKKNYHVIRFDQVDSIANSPSDRPYLILSFDDGYYDFYEHALPLLVKHGLPANHNIVNDCADSNRTIWTERLNMCFEHCLTRSVPLSIEFGGKAWSVTDFNGSWIKFYLKTFNTLLNTPFIEREKVLNEIQIKLSVNGSRRMMNWDQIRECSSNGVEIGSHTITHDSLSTITDSEHLETEILGSKRDMETKLGKPVTIFALPNGQTGKLADAIISNSDFKFVLYVNDGLNPMPPLTSTGPAPVSRINVVDEPFPQMALRIEQFHKMVGKYV